MRKSTPQPAAAASTQAREDRDAANALRCPICHELPVGGHRLVRGADGELHDCPNASARVVSPEGHAPTAQDYVARLRETGEAYHVGAIDHAQFSQRQLATWQEIEARSPRMVERVGRLLLERHPAP